MSDNERKSFEGHGDHLAALCDKDIEEILGEFLQVTVQEGKIAEECVVKRENDKVIFSTVYPEDGDVQLCATMSNIYNDEAFEVITFHPLFEGIKNEVVIDEVYSWENAIEGEVAATIGQVRLSFFAPFFYAQFAGINEGETCHVSLAGLAYSAENAAMECEIGEGEFYEMVLENFLEANPDKTKDDLPFAKVSFDGLPVLFPREYYSEYEYRGKIFEVSDINLKNCKFKKVKILVGRKAEPHEQSDQNDVFINLYIAEHIGKNCDIIVGNDIQGVLWLTGVKACY